MNLLLQAFLDALFLELTQEGPPDLAGLQGGAVPYALAAVLSRDGVRHGVLTSTEEAADRLQEQLDCLLGESAAPARLPVPDDDPYDGLPGHAALQLDRSLALCRLVLDPHKPVLLSVESFLWKTPLPGWWRKNLLILEAGGSLDLNEIRQQMWRLGYRKTDVVSGPGEFAFRGGLVDFYPPQESLPVRVELFGDEIDSLRFFDPASQRSLSPCQRTILVPPLSEAVRDDALLSRLRAHLEGAGEFGRIRLETLDQVGHYPTMDVEVRQDPDFYGSLRTLLGPTRWIYHQAGALEAAADDRLEAFRESFASHDRPDFLAPERLFLSAGEIESVSAAEDALPLETGAGGARVASERSPVFPGEPMKALDYLKERAREGYRCLVLLQGRGTLDRFKEMAALEDIPVASESAGDDPAPGVYAAVSPIPEGVVFPGLKWLVLTEKEIFGRARVRAAAVRRKPFFSNLRDLKPGDHVVHTEHGVGVYKGIETLVRNGVREDYLALSYAANDRLLVPVQKMDLIQKYNGPEGYRPPLDKLGGTAWKKTRQKVAKAVKEIAGELLKLYAARRAHEGRPFGPDTEWQLEFESQFPFELTPDQQKALEDVKRDMENPRPMDRIICGDVGFGKTEVAMQAAFKAAAEGCQVAVLCPTTVLALQHFERFRERFAPFPFKVAMLSRFSTGPEQKLAVKEAAGGKIDIIIGTHRLLSRDVRLPNLGLLIVDEEQRFGVSHKEKIRQMKVQVDTLTLTATPIPRTLQMGLSGILDMSLIQTPPRDRLAIQTSVRPYEDELIKSAIRRELMRSGQVYYVHNRVETIAHAAKRIQSLVPEARVAVAHGQMGERALEDVMLGFYEGETDVLVCTTIIENGVDIPRANTLFVENAHAFGLTQLYQLRGRIGRSNVPAYAYLMTPSGTVPTGDAARRLEALQEFSELGAGFRIAAIDLELRGAGTLLGARQSGHMASVGFEMYMHMLEEAVAAAKGEPLAHAVRCEMNLGLDLSVPVDYMEEVNERLSFYRSLSLAGREDEVNRLAEETADRFGPLPLPVERLMRAARLRIQAERIGIRLVGRTDSLLTIQFDPQVDVDTQGLLGYVSTRKDVKLEPSGRLRLPYLPKEDPLSVVGDILQAAAPRAEQRGAP